MRVSVFKPQTALEVRRSILGSRCLSELLEPAQLGQLSCQKGHLWDSRRFLDLHGPELLQEAMLLWWLWRDCFHTDPGSKKKVHERQQLEWVEPSLFARQFWFTSHLKGSRWFLSLPEPRVPGMCVRVSAGVHVSSDQIHLTKFCGVLLCLNQANGISCTFQHCSAKNVQDQKIMWNHVKQTS